MSEARLSADHPLIRRHLSPTGIAERAHHVAHLTAGLRDAAAPRANQYQLDDWQRIHEVEDRLALVEQMAATIHEEASRLAAATAMAARMQVLEEPIRGKREFDRAGLTEEGAA